MTSGERREAALQLAGNTIAIAFGAVCGELTPKQMKKIGSRVGSSKLGASVVAAQVFLAATIEDEGDRDTAMYHATTRLLAALEKTNA